MDDLIHEGYSISREEIEGVIKDCLNRSPVETTTFCAELLQNMGEKGMEIMSRLINKIYKLGYIPEDFRKSIFVAIPRDSRAKKIVITEQFRFYRMHQRYCYI